MLEQINETERQFSFKKHLVKSLRKAKSKHKTYAFAHDNKFYHFDYFGLAGELSLCENGVEFAKFYLKSEPKSVCINYVSPYVISALVDGQILFFFPKEGIVTRLPNQEKLIDWNVLYGVLYLTYVDSFGSFNIINEEYSPLASGKMLDTLCVKDKLYLLYSSNPLNIDLLSIPDYIHQTVEFDTSNISFRNAMLLDVCQDQTEITMIINKKEVKLNMI